MIAMADYVGRCSVAHCLEDEGIGQSVEGEADAGPGDSYVECDCQRVFFQMSHALPLALGLLQKPQTHIFDRQARAALNYAELLANLAISDPDRTEEHVSQAVEQLDGITIEVSSYTEETRYGDLSNIQRFKAEILEQFGRFSEASDAYILSAQHSIEHAERIAKNADMCILQFLQHARYFLPRYMELIKGAARCREMMALVSSKGQKEMRRALDIYLNSRIGLQEHGITSVDFEDEINSLRAKVKILSALEGNVKSWGTMRSGARRRIFNRALSKYDHSMAGDGPSRIIGGGKNRALALGVSGREAPVAAGVSEREARECGRIEEGNGNEQMAKRKKWRKGAHK